MTGAGRDRPATAVVTAGRRPEWTGAAISAPVWRASTITYADCAALEAGQARNADGEWFYGRRGTPTQWSLADALTALEPGAAGTMLYPSGAAAVAGALMAVVGPGDHLLVTDNVYDPTRRLCDELLHRWGVETTYFAPGHGAAIAALLRPNTRAVMLESPGSLTFEVEDVPAVAAAARAAGVVTLLDNTWATSLLFPALAHGVDVSIVACTKYIVGHSDAMLGSATATPALWPRLRATAQVLGHHVAPDDAWLAARGLRTLDVRLRRHGETGVALAQRLQAHPKVAAVLHPALPEAPGHALWRRDFAGASGLFALRLVDPSREAARRVVDALTRFAIGYSWGGFESLALPVDPALCRSAAPWSAGALIRLHAGLENVEDLWEDLDRALAAA